MQKKEIDLLAPAGSFESLIAGIQAGANAVYFGVEQLNMRSRSSNNFTVEDLSKISKICKKNKIKSYLTLNTIVYDHDISLMKTIVDVAKKNKIDAIIVSDQAVFNYSKKVGMKTHVSTQANISNIESVEFYSAYSDAVVLARELSLMQVAAIVKEIKRRDIKGPSGQLIQVEIFAHGALCMAISGKCYMSLHSNFASANRGACIQNCRKSYVVIDKEDGVEFEVDNEYIMSAKDLCTIEFLDQIIDAGVSIIKIEGRGRSADYVSTVVACYREAIDACLSGKYSSKLFADWKKRLSTVFNRGFWDGYYLGRTIGEWNNVYGSKATKQKVFIGKGLKYFKEISVGEFKMESHSLSVGDEILITGPTTGVMQFIVDELRIDEKNTQKVNKGQVFSIVVNDRIRPSDKIYKLIDV